VAPGQTCLIHAGTYSEKITIKNSGTSLLPITFTGETGVYLDQIFVGTVDNTACASNITLNNLSVGSASNFSYGVVNVNRCSNSVIIKNSTVDAFNVTGIEGVSLYGNNATLSNSTIQNIDNTYFISVGEGDRRDGASAANITVTRNLLRNGKDADAFRVHGINHVISFNEVKDIDKDALVDRNHGDFVQWFTNDNDCLHSYNVQNILIEGNYVHDIKNQVWYGNNVCQTYGAVTDNIIFRNNIFYKVGLMSQDHGEILTNLKVYNNIFDTVGYMYYLYGTQRSYSTQAISFGAKTSGVEVKNNVFLNSSDTPTSLTQGCYSTNNPAGLIAINNYCAGSGYTAKAKYYFTEVSPSINGGDPKFINLIAQDYHLLAGSPLIGVGANLSSSFGADKDGSTRSQTSTWDIGAYTFSKVATSTSTSTPSVSTTTPPVATTTSPADITSPVISLFAPDSPLPSSTIETPVSVSTDEVAVCRYSFVSSQNYSLMPNIFSTTGARTHTVNITGLIDGSIKSVYIRCSDTSGNTNSGDFIVNIEVSSPIVSTSTQTTKPTKVSPAKGRK
jgi:hypothetical protein